MNPKKILIISDVSSYMRGGVPTETRHLIAGLNETGFKVALAANAVLCQSELTAFLQLNFPLNKKEIGESRPKHRIGFCLFR